MIEVRNTVYSIKSRIDHKEEKSGKFEDRIMKLPKIKAD